MLAPARALALALPALLMAGALGSQYIGGLVPCELCMWQRWPHYAAIVAALLAILLARTALTRPLTILAGLLILASGAIGVYHAGVEYRWWAGPSHCTGIATGHGADLMRAILSAPIVQCDVPQWTLFHVSLAGFNALFSLAGGLAVLALAGARSR
ncbi:disulfide bond formation protein B [Sphingomonas nostoxanthinifaciens]|uniref:disulfide bond formation protein B n=1 Tax=Sphingomonas nostoxanthinifaciens TaxID=2872652 RepID=UPI001CC1D60D|nr:disulfide bond formation protein B [Sphingomonas nostoxanthinifaciens]UAK24556.1 disulfide bond formation protein B [Sphingomonas nostoxanthinifaciens]